MNTIQWNLFSSSIIYICPLTYFCIWNSFLKDRTIWWYFRSFLKAVRFWVPHFLEFLARNYTEKELWLQISKQNNMFTTSAFVLTRGMAKITKQKVTPFLNNYCIYNNTIIVSLFICSSIIVSFEKWHEIKNIKSD